MLTNYVRFVTIIFLSETCPWVNYKFKATNNRNVNCLIIKLFSLSNRVSVEDFALFKLFIQ